MRTRGDSLIRFIDKKFLVEELRARTSAQLEALMHSQKSSQAGATHEETRAEDPKDTRATEASYLARGLAERVEQLQAQLDRLSALEPPEFQPTDPVAIGALITVEKEDGEALTYFLLPSAGGESIPVSEDTVQVLSPSSPLGQKLLGQEAGEEITLDLPRGPSTLLITHVA